MCHFHAVPREHHFLIVIHHSFLVVIPHYIYILYVHTSVLTTEPWGRGCDIDVTFRAERSTSYSLHPDQLCIAVLLMLYYKRSFPDGG